MRRDQDGRSGAGAPSGHSGSAPDPSAIATGSGHSASVPNAIAELQRLIDLCEEAEFGSRLLDAQLYVGAAGHPNWKALNRDGSVADHTPRYSLSLDAALSLLPEGADWRRLTHQSISVYAANPYNANAQKRFDGMGATPALAMCAAALRLRLAPLLQAQAIEARRAATAKTGAVEDESAVGGADAPNPEAQS